MKPGVKVTLLYVVFFMGLTGLELYLEYPAIYALANVPVMALMVRSLVQIITGFYEEKYGYMPYVEDHIVPVNNAFIFGLSAIGILAFNVLTMSYIHTQMNYWVKVRFLLSLVFGAVIFLEYAFSVCVLANAIELLVRKKKPTEFRNSSTELELCK